MSSKSRWTLVSFGTCATMVLGLTLTSCKTTAPPSSSQTLATDSLPESATITPNLCAAVRGNGNYIFTHFAALARIVEQYGIIDAAAGGSSASISIFAYESILMNPVLNTCGEGTCTDRDRALRVALLLKSLRGYFDFIATTDEALAFRQLAPIVQKVREQRIAEIAETDIAAASRALQRILSSRDLRDIVNPEVLEQLQRTENQEFHVNEVIAGIQNIGTWSLNTDRVFFRPGILSFRAIAGKLGRVGSFYAGYGPADNEAMSAFLDECAPAAAGKSWAAIAGSAEAPTSCGRKYFQLLGAWRTKLLDDEEAYKSRIDDPVGKLLPAFIATSVLNGPQAVGAWQAAMTRYRAGQEPNLQLNFADVKFGYWGRKSDLSRVGANPQQFNDAKTARFLALGPASWREALTYSPAEPGLSRSLEINSNQISAGGWPDLAPTLVLKNLGCRNTIYVTRQGAESEFTKQVARQLDMTPAQERELYEISPLSPNLWSGFQTSVRAADAVWCTNWNSFTDAQITEMADESYAPLVVTASPFFKDGPSAYPRITPTGPVGCHVGAGTALR